jgi:hypothetical protein
MEVLYGNIPIILDDNYKVKWFKKKPSYFVNKSIVLFGGNNTGKSTIIRNIVHVCQPHIPCGFVICPTNSVNRLYNDIFPDLCIKEDVSSRWLENFISEQKGRSSAAKKTNDLNLIGRIFERVSDEKQKNKVRQIRDLSSRTMLRIQNDPDLTKREKISKKFEVKSCAEESIRKIIKSTIRAKRKSINTDNMSDEEKLAINCIDLNPNGLLILDDCGAIMKQLYKENQQLFKEVFYMGRHYNLTIIIALQDDKELVSELRKNVNIFIFTSPQAATATFRRESNNYSSLIKERAKSCIDKVFPKNIDEEDEKYSVNNPENFKKLVFITNETVFRYFIADVDIDTRFGCKYLWILSDKIRQKNNMVMEEREESDAAFFKRYIT